MTEKIIDLISQGNIMFPKILLLNYKNLKITEQELILLIYLLNTDHIFNPKKYSKELNIKMTDILESVSNLEEKGILKINTRKNNNITEEYLDFKNLYNKLAFYIIEEKNDEEKPENLFDSFEKEFARTLSPVEYELINGWKEIGYSEEIIKLALKEAVFNGVTNLRYIDKILYEWKRKGINNKEDVEKDKKKFANKNKEIEKRELIDYDWLNDDE